MAKFIRITHTNAHIYIDIRIEVLMNWITKSERIRNGPTPFALPSIPLLSFAPQLAAPSHFFVLCAPSAAAISNVSQWTPIYSLSLPISKWPNVPTISFPNENSAWPEHWLICVARAHHHHHRHQLHQHEWTMDLDLVIYTTHYTYTGGSQRDCGHTFRCFLRGTPHACSFQWPEQITFWLSVDIHSTGHKQSHYANYIFVNHGNEWLDLFVSSFSFSNLFFVWKIQYIIIMQLFRQRTQLIESK